MNICMRPELSASSKIRERLITKVEALRHYSEIEMRGNGQLFLTYQILDVVENKNGRASHRDINQQVLSGNSRDKIQALELLHDAGVLEVDDHGSKNIAGGFKIVNCNYSLTNVGRT